MFDNKKQVTVMLARLPTTDDYKAVGITSGFRTGILDEGNQLINALMDQFNDNLRVEWVQSEELFLPDYRYTEQAKKGCVFFECDKEGFEGSWYLPADLFTVRDNFDLKD